ncbi:GGDEF domain-containing protein [Pseudofrankia sp. BMG5.36]|uniref:GGDEF domain-containing protein n=1 Tax=Pseudofrankia sp. BMG5.36 TaxID=1834512 RepID=UPI0032D59B4E
MIVGSAAIVGCALACALFLDRQTAGAAINAMSAAALLATAVACFWTARLARGTERRWRLLIGLAAAGAVGPSIGTAQAMMAGGSTMGRYSPAQAGFLVLYAVALAGLLSLPTDSKEKMAGGAGSPRRGGYRWYAVTLLDCVLIVGSIVLLEWVTMLGAIFRAGAPDLTQFLVVAGTPIGGLTLTTAVALIAFFRRSPSPLTLAFLGAGLLFIAIFGSIFAYLTASKIYNPPAAAYVGFTVGDLLLFLSALVPARAATPDDELTSLSGPRSMWAHAVLPYVALVAAGLVVGVKMLADRSLDWFETYSMVGLLLVALVRQMLTLAENTQLLAEIRKGEKQLHYQAYHDPLTGLANRALFTRRLQRALDHGANGSKSPTTGSVIFMDLDKFKYVNDTFGHAAGDELLKISAERIRAGTRAGDTVARLGGDEFAVILNGGDPDTRSMGERLTKAMQEPCLLGGQPYVPRVSVGLVTLDSSAQPATPDLLLHQADQAMYAAKREGTGGLIIYHPDCPLSKVSATAAHSE